MTKFGLPMYVKAARRGDSAKKVSTIELHAKIAVDLDKNNGVVGIRVVTATAPPREPEPERDGERWKMTDHYANISFETSGGEDLAAKVDEHYADTPLHKVVLDAYQSATANGVVPSGYENWLEIEDRWS